LTHRECGSYPPDVATVDDLIEQTKQARSDVQDATALYEAKFAAAYVAGASLRRLADELDMTVEGVRKALIRLNVEIRPPHVRLSDSR
jgi:hypothetical protein